MKKHNYYLISFFTKRLKLFTATVLLLTAAITTHAQTWTQAAKDLANDGEGSDNFGLYVAIDGDYAIVGAIGDDDKGSNAGAAYVFLRSGTSWTQQAKLLANDGAAGDFFGVSVAISGDYAVVGATGEDAKGTDAGAAYVFKRSGTSWSQEAKLLANDGAAGDQFGNSVAISGDYALIGAYYDDDKGSSSGSAYVFVRSGTSWTQQSKVVASDGAASDYFGWSVSISGDYALIGAYKDDNSKGTDAGAAYVFLRSGTTWTQQAKLLANDGRAADEFGHSVSISGDYAIIGALRDDNTKGTDAGAAYIFVRSGTTWTQQAKLLASDGAATDEFGRSVSIDGDYAIVGAPGEDTKGSSSGSAYVFKRSGTSWSQQSKIVANDGAADDNFGYSVSISGDYALIGAYGDDDKGSISGSAYVFKRSGTSWTQQSKLLASDGVGGDYFGISVSIDGDYALIGARYQDNTKGTNAGAAYFFDAPVCSSTSTLPTTASTTYTGAYANTDANGWTHYCSSDDKLLLSLDTAGSGAVVAAGEVQLKLGANKAVNETSFGGMVTNPDGYTLIDRMWDVNPTTQPTTGEVGVRHYFTAAEYSALVTAAAAHKNASNVDKPTNITAVTDLGFYKSTSGAAFDMPHTVSGIVLTNDATASTSTWVYAAKGSDHSAEFKVASFSGGGGGAGANNLPLPVELLAFTATPAKQHTAMLRWTTATEINNNRFDIERSYDGRTFEVVGDVAGNGNSQHQIDYTYTDASVSKVQKTVYYRLKQVDFDGAFEYSDIRVVRFDALGNDMQLAAFPNPLNNELNVMVGLSNGESYQLEVTNLQGALIHQENHTYDNGIHKLNTSEWNSGMYIVEVVSDRGSEHIKVMKK